MKQIDFFLDYLEDGWIKNSCLESSQRFPPGLSPTTRVDVKWRNGHIKSNSRVDDWVWKIQQPNMLAPSDIMEYRISK